MKAYDRTLQWAICLAVRASKWKMPELIEGNNSILKLANQIKQNRLDKILLITTKGMIKRGSLDEFFAEMEKEKISYIIFNDVMADPTIACANTVAKFYLDNQCDGIVAIGGGSVLDCAKIAAARVVKPNCSVQKMSGIYKVMKKLPPFYAVPTTAGTGSETTVSAVVTDETTHYKFAVSDPCLLPDYAFLDPKLTKDLPPKLTATTGMDALCHAIEAYTNLYSSKEADEKAKIAVKLIMNNLEKAYDDGTVMEYRQNMLKGSFYAGEAFTRAFVGYVHAIAHAVGGLYGVSHGEAIAIILPYVMEKYGETVYISLSELAKVVDINENSREKSAKEFICRIRKMNNHMQIPKNLPQIQESDIPEIVQRVTKEVHVYPTPVIWGKEELRELILEIRG